MIKYFQKISFLYAAFFLISGTTYAQCDSTNSPSFQVTVSHVTLSTNGICGAQINLSNALTNPFPGGPISYSFVAPNQLTLNLPPTIITTSGTWTVLVKDNFNFCITSKTVQVNILSAPSVSIIASNTICSGKMATLTASGANSYSWNTGAKTASIFVYPTSTTIFYSVVGIDTNGCSNTASHGLDVTVKPSPNLTVGPNQKNICVNETITLTASGANTYTWSNSQTDTSITLSPVTSTSLIVFGTNEFGCESYQQIFINVSPCTSIENLKTKNEELKIFPNPANYFVEIKILNDILFADFVKVSIYNLVGQVVREEKILLKGEPFTINTRDLAEDVYFVQIKNGPFGISTKKFVVKH